MMILILEILKKNKDMQQKTLYGHVWTLLV